jgi:hypothetical protein
MCRWCDPRDPNTIYIGLGDRRTIYALADFQPEIWITRDAGTTWTKGWGAGKFDGAALSPGALAVSAADANLVYWGRRICGGVIRH